MALLIVDDETATRDALREMLISIGHKTILDAKNGEEALRFIESEKKRLTMIISDWEMPYMNGVQLLDAVSKRPDLELIPFVLITSDLPKSKLHQLRHKYERLDAHLIKPFQKNALARITSLAARRRQSHRATLIFCGTETPESQSLRAKLQNQPGRLGHRWIHVQNLEELKKSVETEGKTLGAILIQPDLYHQAGHWLTSFKKTQQGTVTLIGCLGTDPKDVTASEDLQTIAQFFSKSVVSLWEAMEIRREKSWEADLLFQQGRTALQGKEIKFALRAAERLVEMEPTNPEAWQLLADIEEHMGNSPRALQHFQKAIEIHPFSPKSNIKFLDCLAKSASPTEITATINQVLHRFPQNVDVLFAAAKVSRSKELAERALTLQPAHRGLKELLESFN